jgi:hypothetical protein
MTCTDQPGQSSLPSSCPVCEHTPVAAEDCKPNKSLRTTIKVFLRTEEKKREDRRLKDIKNSPVVAEVTPMTPVELVATPTIPLEPAPASASDVQDQGAAIEASVPEPQQEAGLQNNATEDDFSIEAQKDIPQPSIEARFLPIPM